MIHNNRRIVTFTMYIYIIIKMINKDDCYRNTKYKPVYYSSVARILNDKSKPVFTQLYTKTKTEVK